MFLQAHASPMAIQAARPGEIIFPCTARSLRCLGYQYKGQSIIRPSGGARQGYQPLTRSKATRRARNALLCAFHKTYGTDWGTETIFATAGTPFVLNTNSI
jgi:hypothetical protein